MSDEQLQRRAALVLLTDSPVRVAVIDPDHRLELTNGAFDATFPTGESDLCYRVYKGRAEPCEICSVSRTWCNGEPSTSDEEGITREDKLIQYRVHNLPLRGADGNVELVVQVIADRTRLAELEAGLDQAERLARVGMTTAGLAHTIKNLLSGLDGGAYVLESGMEKEDDERVQAGWEMVSGYLDQVKKLVRNLLDYSRPKEPELVELDPGELVQDVVQLYGEKAKMAGAKLEARITGEPPSISADREALHAALTNLVTNAVDACRWDPDLDKAHTIVVAAEKAPQGGVIFEVRDNGTGISEENQRKIGVAFFTTKGVAGTGLGLLMTKKTVEEHGGTIDFESTPGEGTTFRLELPAA